MDTSPLLPLHRASGARFAGEPPHARLLTFGDVPAEYAAGTAGCLVFDETERGLVNVTGAESVPFLHRLLAADVRSFEPGEGGRNLLLSGKGKIQQDFDLERTEDGFILSTPPGQAAALVTALDMYLFADQVELEDKTATCAPLAVVGPKASAVIARALGIEPARELHGVQELDFRGHATRMTHLPIAGSPGWRIDAGPEGASDLFEALREAGAVPAGLIARDILRVEAGRARWGDDIDDGIYPQEARLEEAFSLEKGCYIGQEVVAKIDTYGGLNKCLFGLRVSHDDPVPRGTRLGLLENGEWRELGIVTSWAYSFVLDTGLVLGYVKRKHQDEGTEFQLRGDDGEDRGTATIVPMPVRAL